jgi:hypothetical protein
VNSEQWTVCFRPVERFAFPRLVKLFTVHCALFTVELLRFLVRLVLAAAVTELLELETARGRLLVLGG